MSDAAVAVLPPVPSLAKWEENMTFYAAKHMERLDEYDTVWEGFPWYYDAGWAYYQIADYTGDPSWGPKGQLIMDYYKNDYVLANNGRIPGWRVFCHGFYEHWKRTGDEASKECILDLAARAAYAYQNGGAGFNRSRETAYALNAKVHATLCGEALYATAMLIGVEYALGHIEQWFDLKSVRYFQPFMVALTCHSLYEWDKYINTVDGVVMNEYMHNRIYAAIKKSADTLWDMAWCEGRQAFWYQSNSDKGAPCTAYNEEHMDKKFKFLRFKIEGLTINEPLPVGTKLHKDGSNDWTAVVIAGSDPERPHYTHIEVLTGAPEVGDIVASTNILGAIEIVTSLDWRTDNQGAPDLNMFFCWMYGLMFKETGDVSYIDKGDKLFAGGVAGAWIAGGKQFTQSYRLSFLYLKLRSEAVIEPPVESSSAGPEPPAPVGGLIHEYPLEWNALDNVGYKDGIALNMEFVYDPARGNVASFSGMPQSVIKLPVNDPDWLPIQDFSLSFRVKFNHEADGTEYVLDMNHGDSSTASNELGYCVRRNINGCMQFLMTTLDNPDEDLTSATVLIPGLWYHIVVTRYGGFQAMYIQAELDCMRECSTSLIDFEGNYDNSEINFGGFTRAGHGSISTFWFDGCLSEVGIYNKALSSDEVKAIFDGDAPPTPEPLPEMVCIPKTGKYTITNEAGIITMELGPLDD
jgi:hypothetical protein